jgi:hypothetical protein
LRRRRILKAMFGPDQPPRSCDKRQLKQALN